jgi:hypothetical protein
MDQTLMYYSMDNSSTIKCIGTCTVNLRMSTNDIMCMAVAATITASERKVKSMGVFKGECKFDKDLFLISY